MRKKLSLELRRELLTRTAEDYASVRKGIKSQIVDQLVAATGYGRKYAITLLNNPPSGVSSSRPRRARYDERVKRPLVTLWTTANRICAKRLVPFLPELIEVMERNGHLYLPADVREKLLTISSATADRLLATERSNQRGVVQPDREAYSRSRSRYGPSPTGTIFNLVFWKRTWSPTAAKVLQAVSCTRWSWWTSQRAGPNAWPCYGVAKPT